MIHCISTVCSVVYNVVLGRGGAKALYFFLGGGVGEARLYFADKRAWSERAIFPLCLLYDTAFRFGFTINLFFNLQRCAVYVNN